MLLSGATALAYEIVWTRRLALLLGSTTEAAAAVLSSFMFGLALGAVLVGRRADASRRPLRWYGILEIGLGLYALGFDTFLGLARGMLPGSPWALSFLVLVLPAALMGGTLPVLARAAAQTTERGTHALGHLYGINTLGAVLGALVTTFALLGALGLTGTTTLAAGVNIGLGALFWALSRGAGEREVYGTAEERQPRPWTGDAEPAVVAAFFLAGFAGLALEIAWVRFLVYFLEGFTIAFGLMLACYLLGLGAGAIGGTLLALKSENPRRLLARLLLLEAVLACGTLLLAPAIGDSLEEMRSASARADAMGFSYAFGLFLAAAAVILPPTLCAGMMLPVVARIALSDRESIGSQTGAVYAATTLGAVVAPPVAGFVLVPALGVPGTIVALAALVLVAGTWVAMGRGIREWVPAGAAALLFVVAALLARPGEPLVLRSHVFRAAKSPRRLLAFREGPTAGVSVVEELRNGARRLYLDDFSAAETGPQYGYMRMLGHLPVLLHPEPENVLVIAFGTGTTAGAVSVHPQVTRIDCVEIEPMVYEVAGEFAAQNRGVLNLDRTRRIVADGREFVSRAEGAYDVVTLEPLMPYTPAAVYLYTKEFYEAARGSLRKGGLLCQWIPPQGVSNPDLRRLVASMTAVFPHVSLWYFEHAVLVLGGDAPPRVDPARLAKAPAEVFADLRAAHVGSLAHMLGAHVCSGEELAKALGDAAPMVDDRTDLEFRPLPRRFGRRSALYHAENLEFLARIHQDPVPWMEGAIDGAATAVTGMGAALRTLAVEQRRFVDEEAPPPASVLRDVVARDEDALFARAIHDRRRYVELLHEQRFDEAARLALAPDRSLAYLALANAETGRKRVHYLTLAVRDNALPDPAILQELADSLEGPQKRFCLNRIRILKGEEPEEGDEALPEVRIRDIAHALPDWNEDLAREILDDGDTAGVRGEMERALWEWWKGLPAEERARGVVFLHRTGSDRAVLAARRLLVSTKIDELQAIAPILAPAYPGDPSWEQLCRNVAPAVRAAAADAAVAGSAAHLPILAEMCRDRVADVRLSAFLAFRTLEPEAAKTGYDHRAPADEALAALDRLAGNGRQASAGPDESR